MLNVSCIASECNRYLLSGPDGVPDSALSASSVHPRNGYIHAVARGRLHTSQDVTPSGVLSGAWVAAESDMHQWIGVQCSPIRTHQHHTLYLSFCILYVLTFVGNI